LEIEVIKHTGMEEFCTACATTLNKDMVDATKIYDKLLLAEHSPIRTQMFTIKMKNIPTFVSTHLVRHNIGVEHFVKSNREDRVGYTGDAGRMQPVNHTMFLNAHAVINIGRKRLCKQAHIETIKVLRYIKIQMEPVDKYLADRMVPECVYRNNACPEHNTCGFINEQWKIYNGPKYWKYGTLGDYK